MQRIKVLIVEDSKVMQQVLFQILSSDPELRVIGIASDPLMAREMIKKLNPDVLTLDIMLPFMDGITFLKNLMRLHPMPVVMISSLTGAGSAIALEALSIGAIDYFHKPSQQELADLTGYSKELISMVKEASKANLDKQILPPSSDNNLENIITNSSILRKDIIGIGASTGGIEALESILLQLPKVFPAILVVQHIKKEFGTAFSKRISRLYGLPVVEAENSKEVLPGYIYIAPGDFHLTVIKRKDRYFTNLLDSPPENGHRPSVNMLFHSLAQSAGSDCMGVLLTGMGTDGAEGLKAIHDAGGPTIAQDEATSVVWGMPGAAVKLNAVDYIVPLDKIPEKMLQVLDAKARGHSSKSEEKK